MKLFLTAITFLFLVGCNCSENKNNKPYKYNEGDVVYIKPDSLKVTIIGRMNIDNNIYEVKFYDKAKEEQYSRVKEYEIYGKVY